MCLICKERMIIKRNLKNVFYNFRPLVCSHCFKQKMNYFPYFVVPINKGLLHIFELLENDGEDLTIYNDYFIPYYNLYLKLNMKTPAIYIEKLYYWQIKLFDLLEIGNLIIFTNYFKEESTSEI